MTKQVEDKGWIDLPDDFWTQIISRLPMRSIYHVRGVCETWYNMITNLFSANLLNVKASVPTALVIPANKCPPRDYLLMSHFLPRRNLFMAEIYVTRDYPQARPRTKLEKYDLGCEYGPVASCNGLVLLISSYVMNLNPITYCVSNPIIGQYIKLPFPKDIKGRRYFCGFGFCPSSKLCKVIQFHYQEGESTVVEVHTLGTSTWRDTQINPPGLLDNRVRTGRSIGTYFNGALYWMLSEGTDVFMYCFDLENEIFSSIGAQEFNVREGEKFLGSTGGHLYVSVHLSGVLDVFLMKNLDSWTKVLSIRIPRRTGAIELIKYADGADIIILGCGDIEDNESLNFYLMAWNPKADNGNIIGVEYIRSKFRPVAFVPNFTSLSDAVTGGAYQIKFEHYSKKNRPSNRLSNQAMLTICSSSSSKLK